MGVTSTPPRARGLLLVGIALTLFSLVIGCGRGDDARSSSPTATASAEISRPDVGFRSQRRFDEHYQKHGREFGSIDPDEYLRLAQTLRDRPVGEAVIEIVRKDGTITRFDRDSKAFIAFDQDGIIRTFFRPNDGEDYFRRQAQR